MFATSFILLFMSLVSAVLGFSEIAGSWSVAASVLAFVLLTGSILALSLKWEPRSTCFIYPTFSCKIS